MKKPAILSHNLYPDKGMLATVSRITAIGWIQKDCVFERFRLLVFHHQKIGGGTQHFAKSIEVGHVLNRLKKIL